MKPVLAMYDVRGKQEFIFRTNKLKEIVGASAIIRDCFKDYLFPAAKLPDCPNGIFYYKDPGVGNADFSPESFKRHIENEKYAGEVVYDGGGNFLLLFRDEETFKTVTYEFTKRLLENIGTLKVLGVCVPAGAESFEKQEKVMKSSFNELFKDYEADRKRLYALHRRLESEESNIAPWSCMPIVQVDRATSQPLIAPDRNDGHFKYIDDRDRDAEFSKERYMKLAKYEETQREQENSPAGSAAYYMKSNKNVLDALAPKRGEDSQLAVIYIDGNSMGARVQQCLEGEPGKGNRKAVTYKDCVKRLRAFSDEIQDHFVDKGIVAAMKEDKDCGRQKHRIVVYAGDEVNFIVPAKDAFKCATEYLESLDGADSSCAGIAVFHSHSPYSEAYRIAEECCESGKKEMKKKEIQNACFIDFHICQGATGISLEKIREKETGDIISRPWLLKLGADEKDREKLLKSLTDIDKDVVRLADMFRKLGRNNIKGLASLAKKSDVALKLDLNRIKAHQDKASKEEMEEDWKWLLGEGDGALTEKKRRSLVYDVVIAYDFWFAAGKGGADASGEAADGINASEEVRNGRK